jgi:DNA-binding response OmpR family regulator
MRSMASVQIYLDPDYEATLCFWSGLADTTTALCRATHLALAAIQEFGQIVSRPQIVKTVWDAADPRGVSTNAVDGWITRLRSRLQEAQPKYDYVEVIRGQGLG